MEKTVEIPDRVSVSMEGENLLVKGPKGELRKELKGVKMTVKDNEVILKSASDRRKDKAMLGTWRSHTENMIIGVTVGWEARMKMVYSHFPVKFGVERKKIVIQNFMGERSQREAKIFGASTKVEVKKDDVIITGIDKEDVGQTAANIELACKVKGYDRRVFQDGCHLVQKTRPIETEGDGKDEQRQEGKQEGQEEGK